MTAVVMMPPPIPASLGDEQLRQLADAQRAGKKIRRAVSVATSDAWAIAVFAALTFIGGLFSPSGLILGIGMGVVATIEFKGAGRLRRVDEQSARMLGWNQLALAGLLILYALWSIHTTLTTDNTLELINAAGPEVSEMIRPLSGLMRKLTVLVYICLIAVAIAAQGGMAWYYFSRIKHIRAYLTQTPNWILQMQQKGVTI
ncbi:MAG: hypothetical protein IT447_05725 [Phycisphaerales bacterium]|nr:hypothetical protein [Phycisphaerales bacterium]